MDTVLSLSLAPSCPLFPTFCESKSLSTAEGFLFPPAGSCFFSHVHMLWKIEFSSNEASLVNGLTMFYRNTAADARISPIVRACVCVCLYAEVLQLLAEIENGFLFANFCATKQAVLVKLKLACNPKPSLLPPAALQFQPSSNE